MRKVLFILGIISSLTFASCGQKANEEQTEEKAYVSLEKMSIETLEEEIAKREKVLNQDKNGIDSKNASDLMEAYTVYAVRFPNRANSADRMFKAAELAMSLNHTIQAIKYFAKVYNEYPDYEKRPYALFLKAFVLENQARDYVQAESVYQEFLRLYPGHDMADDAEYSIQNMGKTPEELIREFEKQDSIKAAQEGV